MVVCPEVSGIGCLGLDTARRPSRGRLGHCAQVSYFPGELMYLGADVNRVKSPAKRKTAVVGQTI